MLSEVAFMCVGGPFFFKTHLEASLADTVPPCLKYAMFSSLYYNSAGNGTLYRENNASVINDCTTTGG